MQGEQETEGRPERETGRVFGDTLGKTECSETSGVRMETEKCRQQVWQEGTKTWKCVRSWVAELSRPAHGDLVSPALLP